MLDSSKEKNKVQRCQNRCTTILLTHNRPVYALQSDSVAGDFGNPARWSRIQRYTNCSTVMSTFDNLGTASAQLAALLERGEYDRLAQLLDSLELQVRQ